MNTDLHNLLQQALALPEDDRAAIAASLIHSLDFNAEDDAEEQWHKEIQSRIAEIDNGSVDLISAASVMEKMRIPRNG